MHVSTPLRTLAVCLAAGLFSAAGVQAQTVNLFGRVVDPGENPLEGVFIELDLVGGTDTTDTNGQFSLAFTSVAPVAEATASIEHSQLQGRNLLVRVAGGSQRAVIDVYGLSGRRLARVFDGQLGEGVYAFNTAVLVAAAAPSATLLRVSIGRQTRVHRLPAFGLASPSTSAAVTGTVSSQQKSVAAIDTLTASLAGYLTKRVGIDRYVANVGTIVLMPANTPDLIIEAIDAAPNPASLADDTVSITVTVKNTGGGTAAASALSVHCGDCGIDDTLNVSSLAAGASAAVVYKYPVSDSGDFGFVFVADALDGVTEASEANNTDSVVVTVSPQVSGVDLVIDTFYCTPANPFVGVDATFTIRIANTGSGRTDTTMVAILVDDGSTEVEYTVPPLNAGSSYTCTHVHRFADIGNYGAEVFADSRGTEDEMSESNNTKRLKLEVTRPPKLPDLVIDSMWYTPNRVLLNIGDTVTIGAVVKNQGLAASEATDATIELPRDTLTREPVPALGPDEAFKYNVKHVFRANGTYIVGARVDTRDRVAEIDEANNVDTISIRVGRIIAPF